MHDDNALYPEQGQGIQHYGAPLGPTEKANLHVLTHTPSSLGPTEKAN